MFGKKPWKPGKPTKCAKSGFQGKCRASCNAYWGPKTDIEFCTPKGTMAWPGSKEELLAKMGGAPAKKGSVDWTAGVACARREVGAAARAILGPRGAARAG